MPRFFYKAKRGPQEIVENWIDAESEPQALSKISALGLFPVSIVQEGDISKSPKKDAFFKLFLKIKTIDLAIFTRQLADLLDSGLTIITALDILAKQTENKKLRTAVGDIRDFIKTGNTFTSALKRYPGVFSGLYVSMVHAGEVSGTLESVLNRLADFLEEQEEFKTKVQAALAYPALMAFVGFGTIIILITFVMPRVVGIFEDLGQTLPVVTLMLLGVSAFLRNYWYILIGGIVFLVFMIRKAASTSEGKSFFDKIKSKTPLIGPLLRKVDIARFSRTLGTLLNNGVTLLESLEIVRNVMSNESAKKDVEETFNKVRDGSPLARALSEGSYFPLFVTNMIAVGEESGQLERGLFKIAASYEREVDKQIKIVSSLIEPVMILVMGIIVGFIVIAILLPIFQISLIAQ